MSRCDRQTQATRLLADNKLKWLQWWLLHVLLTVRAVLPVAGQTRKRPGPTCLYLYRNCGPVDQRARTRVSSRRSVSNPRRFSFWGVNRRRTMPASSRQCRTMTAQGSMLLLLCLARPGGSFLLNPGRDRILSPSLQKKHRFAASRRNQNASRLAAEFPRRNYNRWDGDDVRWTSRLRRRWLGSLQYGLMNRSTIMRTSLLWTTLLVYLYQAYNTIFWIRQAYPASWPNAAPSIVMDTLLGSARAGPFTTALCYTPQSARLSPWRYLTSGFLHSSILHWAFTMDALRRLPGWLEELGGGNTLRSSLLYMTTFWVATVSGNLASQGAAEGWVVGASGGIAGLYGLMYVSLIRMSNPRATSMTLRGAG